MTTYSTLEEIKVEQQGSLFADNMITLRSEQRDAIDRAKNQFCTRVGSKATGYQWTLKPKYSQYLWNAKMRFGKTVCAMQLMRELDVKRTLIITHRPVVGDSWMKAFRQVVGSKSATPVVAGNSDLHNSYGFGTRTDNEKDGDFYELEKFLKRDENNHYAFFVSMQYIRLSELVNANTKSKNKDQDGGVGNASSRENEKLKADILNTDWDLIIIDEAHEGTLTSLGRGVIKDFLKKEKTKMLYLSGTPFNLYEDFGEDEIFTWDYIAEQQAKRNWDIAHPGEKNPYAELPKLNIFTYDITKNIDKVLDQTGVFTFQEFFRTWTGNPKADKASMPDGARGRFVHEEDVVKFLNLLCTKDEENNFPFSTNEYRQMFRHTLWVVSHVNEAAALEQLLKEHKTFQRFNVINVAGNNDSDELSDNALDKVLNAIGEMPEKTSTITISCGRLTTGVTVAPWSAVFYLKGGDRAATYMQTIFRVQSPYKIDGKMKTECYVFDFAPDRTLKIVAETSKFSSMAKAKAKKPQEGDEDKTQEQRDKETVKDFIELCPVISMDGGQMRALDVNTIYNQLENVFIDRLVRKGFDDLCLYNQDELNKVNPEIINHIGENGGQAPDESRKDAKPTVDLSHMTEEQRKAWEEKIKQKKAEAAEKAKKKAEKDAEFKKQWDSWSEAERKEWLRQEAERIARREKAKEEREEFKKRITNIRGIALRIPLLMYGGADAGDPKDDLTVENFTRKIKDESWAEFMPKGISKEDFNKIKKCFNATRFEEAGKRYRAITREADFMHVDERIKQITEIFSYFRNPDKETVLTPWRVVNMHMSDTIGGYCFFDETFDEKTGMLEKPRFVDQGDVTKQLFDNVVGEEVQTKILEINSKTGLYPLYVTYSLYRRRLDEYVKAQCIDPSTVSVQEEQVVWDDIVTDNMYVICNTPMAVGITRRTLFGFREVEKKANIKNEQLIERASDDREGLIKELKSNGFWKGNTSKQEMKFNAIIGNPPYQLTGHGQKPLPIYHYFIDLARGLNPQQISMISPSRWFAANDLRDFRDTIITENKIDILHDFADARLCFENVEIKGGISYFRWNKQSDGNCLFCIHNENTVTQTVRNLREEKTEILIRDGYMIQIMEKVHKYAENRFNSLISANDPFGFDMREDHSSKRVKVPFSSTPCDNAVEFYYNGWRKDGVGYVNKDIITKNPEWVDKVKILIPKAWGTGDSSKDRLKPFIVNGNTCCTETYLVVGPFDEISIAQNVVSYMETKFFHFMVAIMKLTQNAMQGVYCNVPMQDFSKPWTDEELYMKYDLDMFERQYIEDTIKPME